MVCVFEILDIEGEIQGLGCIYINLFDFLVYKRLDMEVLGLIYEYILGIVLVFFLIKLFDCC